MTTAAIQSVSPGSENLPRPPCAQSLLSVFILYLVSAQIFSLKAGLWHCRRSGIATERRAQAYFLLLPREAILALLQVLGAGRTVRTVAWCLKKADTVCADLLTQRECVAVPPSV